ncbi:hypothetical protein [Sulfurimonas sp.]|uniref:hypothetical protein n=1 Tax=Sulfurimonas sp. TaxID=2022749 RepID=UPI002B48C6F3|nr:hypothetical protein [Sulfurimonas sp.]
MAISLLLAGFSGIASIASFIMKHPFVSKMMIFGVFTALLTLAFTYLKNLVAPYIVGNSLMSLAAYFGVLDGISIYITILVAGFGVKQVLAFVRS